jgi:hypothetical protein
MLPPIDNNETMMKKPLQLVYISIPLKMVIGNIYISYNEKTGFSQ